MYYVYILRSLKDSKLYIGYTTDLPKRFLAHKNGEVSSTRYRRPLEVIFYEAFKQRADAKRREKYFKTSKGKSSLRIMLQETLHS
jgi:putative endonuclease